MFLLLALQDGNWKCVFIVFSNYWHSAFIFATETRFVKVCFCYGFQKASLHKIAEKAGVTTGAIYTRYRNKDALFASLLQDFFESMRILFTPIAEEYEKAKHSAQPEDILRAINAEEQVYFRLLTEHRDDCTLFFCRSDGSS